MLRRGNVPEANVESSLGPPYDPLICGVEQAHGPPEVVRGPFGRPCLRLRPRLDASASSARGSGR